MRQNLLLTIALLLTSFSTFATNYGSFKEDYRCDGMRFDTGTFYSGNAAQLIVTDKNAIYQLISSNVDAIYNKDQNDNYSEAIFKVAHPDSTYGLGGYNQTNQSGHSKYIGKARGQIFTVTKLSNNEENVILTELLVSDMENTEITDLIFRNCNF
ncbi:MAG: hypothetical protein KAQ98_08680 [Bacteriovoracaceae bacterium]|nr:hypothetical protein [Bacteriovoracaceae bacterium]